MNHGTVVRVEFVAISIVGSSTKITNMIHDGHGWVDEEAGYRVICRQSRPVRTRGREEEYMVQDPQYMVEGHSWPGLPVTLEMAGSKHEKFVVEPTGEFRAFKRVRRIPSGREGLVIGVCWRDEGVPHEGTSGGMYGDEYSPGWLSIERRVPLVEVALTPPGKMGKAQLVLAVESDLTLLGV